MIAHWGLPPKVVHFPSPLTMSPLNHVALGAPIAADATRGPQLLQLHPLELSAFVYSADNSMIKRILNVDDTILTRPYDLSVSPSIENTSSLVYPWLQLLLDAVHTYRFSPPTTPSSLQSPVSPPSLSPPPLAGPVIVSPSLHQGSSSSTHTALVLGLAIGIPLSVAAGAALLFFGFYRIRRGSVQNQRSPSPKVSNGKTKSDSGPGTVYPSDVSLHIGTFQGSGMDLAQLEDVSDLGPADALAKGAFGT